MSKGTDIDLAEIKQWLDSVPDDASEIANRAYSASRAQWIGKGEKPKFNRTEWHHLPKDYREFLVSIARYALEHR